MQVAAYAAHLFAFCARIRVQIIYVYIYILCARPLSLSNDSTNFTMNHILVQKSNLRFFSDSEIFLSSMREHWEICRARYWVESVPRYLHIWKSNRAWWNVCNNGRWKVAELSVSFFLPVEQVSLFSPNSHRRYSASETFWVPFPYRRRLIDAFHIRNGYRNHLT